MHNGCVRSYVVARRGMPLLLAICWIIGVVFGVFCYRNSPPEVTSLMHRTVSRPASIVGLLNTALIPFLLSALFVLFSAPFMIPGLCFVKAFLSSFVSMGIFEGICSGGWLLRYFLLFSDCVTLPLLFWYWLRSVSEPKITVWLITTGVVMFVLALVTILDYRIIAPIVCVIDSMKG